MCMFEYHHNDMMHFQNRTYTLFFETRKNRNEKSRLKFYNNTEKYLI